MEPRLALFFNVVSMLLLFTQDDGFSNVLFYASAVCALLNMFLIFTA